MRKLLICLVALLMLPKVVVAQSPTPLTASGLPAPCKNDDSSDVYLIVNGTRAHIKDWTTFLSLGYKSTDIVACGSHANDPLGETITTLLKGSGPEIYWMVEGKRKHIPDMDTFYAMNFKIENVTTLPDDMLSLWPLGEPLASQNTAANLPVACTNDSKTVYLLIEGKRRPVVDQDTLQNLGYKPPDVQPCGSHAADPEGDSFTNVLKGSSDKIYWVFYGQRYLIPDMDTFTAAGLKVKNITNLSDKVLSKWPFNSAMTSVHTVKGGGMYKELTIGDYTIQLYHAIYFRSPDGFAVLSAPNRPDTRIEGIEGLGSLPVSNVLGGTMPQVEFLLKSSWSGHCCSGTALYELGATPTKVFEIWSEAYQYPDTGRGEFNDLNGDNVYEFITQDPVRMGCATRVVAILEYDKGLGRYVGASRRFSAYYTPIIADLTKVAKSDDFCSIFSLVGTLLYLGRTDGAKAEFDRLYRPPADSGIDVAASWHDLQAAVKKMRYYTAS